jgi:hypothetical protein
MVQMQSGSIIASHLLAHVLALLRGVKAVNIARIGERLHITNMSSDGNWLGNHRVLVRITVYVCLALPFFFLLFV